MISIIKRFLFLILPMVVLAACLPTGEPIVATPIVVPTLAATAVPATLISATPIPTAPGTRYTNAEGQFSLQLPDGWQLLASQIMTNDGERPYALYTLGESPASSGSPGNSKIVIVDAQLWTIEAFVQSQCTVCPTHPVEQVTLNGIPAQQTKIGGGSVPFTVTWHFITHNSNLIALAIHDAETLEPLNDVLQSIQLDES